MTDVAVEQNRTHFILPPAYRISCMCSNQCMLASCCHSFVRATILNNRNYMQYSSLFTHRTDPNVPIYSKKTSYTYGEAIKLLLNADRSRIAVKQPVMVEENATFVVDLSKLVNADDIKADDCGQWKHMGKKTTITPLALTVCITHWVTHKVLQLFH